MAIPITWTQYPYFASFDGFKSARSGLVSTGFLDLVSERESLYRFGDRWRTYVPCAEAKERMQKPNAAIRKHAEKVKTARTARKFATLSSPPTKVETDHELPLCQGSTLPRTKVESDHELPLCQGFILARAKVEPYPISIPAQTTTTKTTTRQPAPCAYKVFSGGAASPAEDWPGGGLPEFRDQVSVLRYWRMHRESLVPEQEEQLAATHDRFSEKSSYGQVSKSGNSVAEDLRAAWRSITASTPNKADRNRRMAKVAAVALGQAETRQIKRVCDVIDEIGLGPTMKAVIELCGESLKSDERFRYLRARALGKKGDEEAKL